MHRIVVHVELVEMSSGLWCRACALSSGVQVTVAVSGPRPGLSTARRCTECEGVDVEPVGRDD